ncbi:MAG: lantibiotic dehydratase [Bacteroidota bacterium]
MQSNATGADLRDRGFFVLRSPALPLPQPLPPCRERAWDWARQQWQRRDVQSAIHRTSPRLFRKLTHLLADHQAPPTNDAEAQKLFLVFWKYLLRLSHRCTPFGFFAGISTGQITERTQLSLEDPRLYGRARLDAAWVQGAHEQLMRDLAFRELLSYCPNSTLFASWGTYHFLGREGSTEGHFRFWQGRLPQSIPLQRILTAGQAPRSFKALIAALQSPGMLPNLAVPTLHRWIDQQVFLPTLRPGTDVEGYRLAIEALLLDTEATALANLAESSRVLLASLKAVGQTLGANDQVLDASEAFPSVPRQVDASRSLPGGQIHRRVIRALTRAIHLLRRLPRPQRSHPLDAFRRAFRERYAERSVPLLEVLTEANGLGYPLGQFAPREPDPLLADCPFRPDSTVPSSPVLPPLWRTFLEEQCALSERNGHRPLRLFDRDLKDFWVAPQRSWAPTFYTGFGLLADSATAVDAGDFSVLHLKTGGMTGGRLWNRFVDLSEVLEEQRRRMLREEARAYPDRLVAELAHLPRMDSANLSGSNGRAYAIELYDVSDRAEGIPVSDLWLSLRGSEWILHSAVRGQRIQPYLTHAINPHFRTLPHFRLLADIAVQGTEDHLVWDWGPLHARDFTPRVVYHQVILARARWRLHWADLARGGDFGARTFAKYWRAWARAVHLPDYVLLAEGNQQLRLATDHPLSHDILWAVLRRERCVVLEECLYHSEGTCLKGPGGEGYTNELVVPLSPPDFEVPVRVESLVKAAPVTAVFSPGSEWLAWHLYAGVGAVEHYLRNELRPLLEELEGEGWIDRWFFLRFPDPDFHLRLRLHRAPGRSVGGLLERCYATLERGHFWKIQLEPYRRELERYGPAAIAHLEQLFWVDSVTVLDLLGGVAVGQRPARWLVAVWACCCQVHDFGLTEEQVLSLFRYARDRFGVHFAREGRAKNKWLRNKLAQHQERLDALLGGDVEQLGPAVAAAFGRRSEGGREAIRALRRLEREGQLPLPWEQLCGTLIHLFFNRWLEQAPRHYEAVLYDFLYRSYHSRWARRTRG